MLFSRTVLGFLSLFVAAASAVNVLQARQGITACPPELAQSGVCLSSDGATCSAGSQCASGICTNGICVGSGVTITGGGGDYSTIGIGGGGVVGPGYTTNDLYSTIGISGGGVVGPGFTPTSRSSSTSTRRNSASIALGTEDSNPAGNGDYSTIGISGGGVVGPGFSTPAVTSSPRSTVISSTGSSTRGIASAAASSSVPSHGEKVIHLWSSAGFGLFGVVIGVLVVGRV